MGFLLAVVLAYRVFLPDVQAGTSADPGSAILPEMTVHLVGHARIVLSTGERRHNRRDVVMKVGDSISASPDFLAPLSCGQPQLGAHADLSSVIARVRGATIEPAWATACAHADSFAYIGQTARGHSRATSPLLPAEECLGPGLPVAWDRVACEVARSRPAVAIVMLGTNDIGQPDGDYAAELGRLVDELLAFQVYPILSTIPPQTLDQRGDDVPRINRAVVEVGRSRVVPVVDYWLAMQGPGLVDGGLIDGIHPNVCPCGGADFTDEGLRYGMNRRNLVTVQALDAFYRATAQ